MQDNSPVKPGKTLITSKPVFTVSVIVIVLTILGIWLFGLGQHRTIFENSMLSTSVLSIAFFLFLATGLYNGVKLKDNLGKLTDKLKPSRIPNFSDALTGGDFIAIGDGLEGIVLSIVLWIVATLLLGLLFWLFGAVLWTGIIFFMAMLYWIFFRALRLVFKNSNRCMGNMTMSIAYGLGYTLLYNFWIYAVMLLAHYLVQ